MRAVLLLMVQIYYYCIELSINFNKLIMEYVETDFTDALIDAICGEESNSPEQD